MVESEGVEGFTVLDDASVAGCEQEGRVSWITGADFEEAVRNTHARTHARSTHARTHSRSARTRAHTNGRCHGCGALWAAKV
jgi:hypothetical protein|eukprot:COSAG01_NODE_3380_length_6171_cov_10.687582_5_plen_82_part_00